MNTKRIGVCALLGIFLVLSTFAVTWAEPSHLLVTRDFGGFLWARTCNGTVCSSWTSISGQFASQPTLVWDEDVQRYYLYGVDAGGNIWRSSFSSTGVHDNFWVVTGGASPSPLAGAGGGRRNNFVSSLSADMTGVLLSSTVANIKSVGVYAPYGGFVVVTGSGTFEHYRTSSVGNSWARVFLTTTSGGTQSAWSFTDMPSGTPTGYTSFPFTTSRWFSATAGVDTTYYMTAEDDGSATSSTYILNANLTGVYYPYSY